MLRVIDLEAQSAQTDITGQMCHAVAENNNVWSMAASDIVRCRLRSLTVSLR